MNSSALQRPLPHESISKIGVTLIAAAFLLLTFFSDRLLPFGQWIALVFMLCFLAIVALPPLFKRENRRFSLNVCLLAILQGVASLSYLFNTGDLHPAVIALGALAVALFSYVLLLGLYARFVTLPLQQPGSGSLRVMIYVMVLTLFALCLAWTEVFPADLGAPDTVNQLMQVDGTIPYSNIHTIAHTLLLAIVHAVDPSLGLLMALYYLAIAFLYGLFGRLAYERGVPFIVIITAFVPFLMPKLTFALYTQPLKDLPYSFCIGIVTYLMIRFIEDGSLNRGRAIALGVCLAFTTLFRYNGIVVSIVVGVFFLIAFLKKRQFLSIVYSAVAAAVCVAGVGLISNNVLHAQTPENGFSVQIFGTGIAAVLANDGNVTPEQMAELEEILPVEWMVEHYEQWNARGLVWTQDYATDPVGVFTDENMRVFNNAFIVSIGMHRGEVVRLYVQLFAQNPLICLRELVYGSFAVWGWRTESIQFYYTNVFLLSALLLAMFARIRRGERRRFWLAMLPILCNVVSILISTVTNEIRYLMPTFLLTPVLLLYVFSFEKKWRAGN